MKLDQKHLSQISPEKAATPSPAVFSLPEKVLQFGTGVLLRGLPDYFIDRANNRGLFNGRILVVKSTGQGDTLEFDRQDGLYTIGVRGIEEGLDIQENMISAAISRVVSAEKDWSLVLEAARNPALEVVISNTTEVGIQLVRESIDASPPVSFPAKLLAVLRERYRSLGGNSAPGMVIVATELIPGNGKKLEEIIWELAADQHLDGAFLSWAKTKLIFCNSLVDRIVPGKPDQEKLEALEQELGYRDELLIFAEPYRLWAIEGDERVAGVLSFAEVDKGVIITPDIEIYRELKVRLLNGTHTLTAGIACLSGIETVKEGMDHPEVRAFVELVMQQEIAPAIPYPVPLEQSRLFAGTVIDRFSNPHIRHLWLSITMQYTMKLKIRVLPVLLNYHTCFGQIPSFITFGFAAYLHFMQVKKSGEGKYYGAAGSVFYLINDDCAPYFEEKTRTCSQSDYVEVVLRDREFWGTDLAALPGFIATVNAYYLDIQDNGMEAALRQLNASTAMKTTTITDEL